MALHVSSNLRSFPRYGVVSLRTTERAEEDGAYSVTSILSVENEVKRTGGVVLASGELEKTLRDVIAGGYRFREGKNDAAKEWQRLVGKERRRAGEIDGNAQTQEHQR